MVRRARSLFLLSLIILCGCRDKMSTQFYSEGSVLEIFRCIEQVFPIPFYEKNTLKYEQQDNQVIVSGLVLDSLDRMKEFFLIHADQNGWYLDAEMFFQQSFLLIFKKAKQSVVVICNTHTFERINVQLYIKY